MDELIKGMVSLSWWEDLPALLVAVALMAVLLWVFLPQRRHTIYNTLAFLAFCLIIDLAGAVLNVTGFTRVAHGLGEVALVGQGMAVIRLAGLLLFRLCLPLVGITTPGILEDVLAIFGYVVWGLIRLSIAGVDLSSLLTASAVVSAVLAFAMQDTLGNILGGIALQLDNSLEIGDWVRLDDLSGKVVEIQWRYTAIRTRNGETVVVPNSQLTKNRFVVLGDLSYPASGLRRWIWFGVDYGVSPTKVIGLVERVVANADIPGVAKSPVPNCVVMEFAPGYVHYALRYWLNDLLQDDPTDSAVRVHVLAALQRHGMRVAVPDHRIHLVKEGESHWERVASQERQRRLKALQGVELFSHLSETELSQLADRLIYAPFAKGDVLTQQGAVAHFLYLVTEGEAESWYQAEDGSRRLLMTIKPGEVFGELGLMTGTPRTSSVIARTDVEAYRLDKAGFEDIIHSRPEIAESLSHILARSQQQLEDLRRQTPVLSSEEEKARRRADMLARIRQFFSLS